MKKVLFCGHGRSGKDTCCEYLASITTLRNAGTTSAYLADYVAGKLGLPVAEAYRRRHESNEMRTFWYDAGNEMRTQGPTTLLRIALGHGEITGGLRDLAEVVAAKEEGLVDVIVWIDNNRVPPDLTVKFTERECDIIIPNHWGLADLYERLDRFARFAGLPMRQKAAS